MRRAVVVLAAIAALLPARIADAKGTMRVQQSDGSVQHYPMVTIRSVGKTLRITTADKKGTLVITDAACSYVGNLLRCLPYGAVLEQNGTHQLTVNSGTIYYNPTSTNERLKYSSTVIPPKGVLGLMVSRYGTYVSLSGTLDEGAAP